MTTRTGSLTWLLALGLALTLPELTLAGPNEGGTLILHANPTLTSTSDILSYCGMAGLDSCSHAVTSVTWEAGKELVFHALAAFPPGSSPRLKGVSFGIEYDPTKFVMTARGTCADFELPDGAWPASGTGTAQTWTAATQTGLLTECYWFAGYAYAEDDEAPDSTAVALIAHPLHGGKFIDDAFPAAADTVAGYGKLGFGMTGRSACHQEPGDEDAPGDNDGDISVFRDPADFDSTSLLANIDVSRLQLPEDVTEISVDDLRVLPEGQVHEALPLALQTAGVRLLRKLVPWFDPVIVDRDRQPMLDPDGQPLKVPHDMARWFVLELDSPSAASACRNLRATRLFTHVQLNGRYRECSPPNDPYFAPEQWGLSNAGQYCGTEGFDIRALRAWELFGTGTTWPTKVGVLDSGLSQIGYLELGHEDIYAATSGYNTFVPYVLPYDDNHISHGTACSGLVAMVGGNGKGGAAPAWGITVVPVKIIDADGYTYSENIAQGLDWLRSDGTKVANMSFAGTDPDGLTTEAVLNARAAGMALAAAAGNSNYEGEYFYPAAYRRSVIAVNAFMNDGNVWDDANLCCWPPPPDEAAGASHCADWVDVTAPGGRGIMTTKRPNPVTSYYDLSDLDPDPLDPCGFDWVGCQTDFTGTSAATALVSGVLGAILATNNELDGADAEQIMMRTLTDHAQYGWGYDIQSGWGRPNLEAALARVKQPKLVEHSIVWGTGWTLDGTGTADLIGFPGVADGGYYFERLVWEISPGLVHQYAAPPDAWGRALGSTGFRKITDGSTVIYHEEEPGFTEVVQVASDAITLRTYSYHIRNDEGQWSWFPGSLQPTFSYTAIETACTSGLTDGGGVTSIELAPNPAEVSVRVYSGAATAGGTVEVFDAGGRRVTTLQLDQRGSSDWHLRDAAGHRVAAGAYFLRFRGTGGVDCARLLVVR